MVRSGAPAPAYRCARAVSTGLLCGPGGLAAHLAVGGSEAPPPRLLIVTLAVTGVVVAASALLGSRRAGWMTLLLLAGGAQLAFHHGLSAAAAGHASPAAGPAHAGHGSAGAHGALGSGELSMLLAHAGVALLVAVVAGGAERAWWDLARAAVRRVLVLPALRPDPPVVARRPGTVASTEVAAPTRRDAPEVTGPRGPPAAQAPALVPA